jgi:hypothetical protein
MGKKGTTRPGIEKRTGKDKCLAQESRNKGKIEGRARLYG